MGDIRMYLEHVTAYLTKSLFTEAIQQHRASGQMLDGRLSVRVRRQRDAWGDL